MGEGSGHSSRWGQDQVLKHNTTQDTRTAEANTGIQNLYAG